MNDLERFAYSVEYTTGKKRGRHPVFSSNQFYPYAAERRLQNALKNELEAYIGEAYEVAISGETLVKDSLEDLSNMPDDISENLRKEISYAADSIARKVSGSIVEMTEMTIGKPYYPPEAKKDMLTTWESNFQTLCKSAKSDIKKEMSLLVQQAKNEGWNNKQLIREIRKKLPEKYAGRAENIARTETGKLNTAITLETYKEIGVQYYVWMATMDERTRSDHAMMNGLICSASDPTVWYEENPDDPMHPVEHKRDDTMVHLHPGEDFQCRCTMVMWDPVVDGKYDVKQRPDEENNEENEGNQGNASGNQGNASGNRELEKANRTIAEQKNALETTKNTLETTRNELTRERNARKTAELSKKNAETRISEQKAENAKLREENADISKKNKQLEKTRKSETEKTIKMAESELKEAKKYMGVTNDPVLKSTIEETEKTIKETKNGGLISSLVGKISELKEKIFGLSSEEEMMEMYGVERFKSKRTPIQLVAGSNPTKSENNCPACAAVFELRCRGWNVSAKETVKMQYHFDPSNYYKKPQKKFFSNYDEIKKFMLENGNGSRFTICATFIKKGRPKSHAFSAIVQNDKIILIDAQMNDYKTVDYFKMYKLAGNENFIFRVDDLTLKNNGIKNLME